MTRDPAQLIRDAIEATGLSRLALAETIACDPSTLTRWANGSRDMPGPAAVLLGILAVHPEVVLMAPAPRLRAK